MEWIRWGFTGFGMFSKPEDKPVVVTKVKEPSPMPVESPKVVDSKEAKWVVVEQDGSEDKVKDSNLTYAEATALDADKQVSETPKKDNEPATPVQDKTPKHDAPADVDDEDEEPETYTKENTRRKSKRRTIRV